MIKLKKGDVLNFNFGSGFGPIITAANVIKYVRNGYWDRAPLSVIRNTHTAIIIDKRGEEYLMMEATSKGVISTWYHVSQFEAWAEAGSMRVLRVRMPLRDVTAIAKQYLGAPYAWPSIGNIGIRLFTGRDAFFTRWTSGYNSLICSELVLRILYDASNKSVDLAKEFGLSVDFVSPMQIALSAHFDEVML